MLFKSDGCSFWFDGDWKICCLRHDKLYAAGGTKQQRKFVDKLLRRCVLKKGHPIMAQVMYFGVRIFGGPFSFFSWRWGFLRKKRGYTK